MTRALLAIIGLALIYSSCTNDFGAFSFGRPDGSFPAEGGVSPGDAARDGATGDAGSDSGTPPNDAAMDSGGMDSGIERDASPAEDGSAPDRDAASDTSADDDAGTDNEECRAALGPLVPAGKEGCYDCGCDQCSVEVVACLDSGNAIQDARCSVVLFCALENSCRVWDCYCSDYFCGGSNSPDGNGPCVAEMNTAARGQKSEVMQIWDSGDATEPLVRALDAVSCLNGRHRRSPGGSSTGLCEADCL